MNELVIRVTQLGCGRVIAKVEPVGPVVEAADQETAVTFAKNAHQSFLKTRNQFLPQDAWETPTYRVEL